METLVAESVAIIKPGWKTTEFWISVLTSAGSILASAIGFLPPKYAAIVTAASAGLYSVSRGLAKTGSAAAAETVTTAQQRGIMPGAALTIAVLSAIAFCAGGCAETPATGSNVAGNAATFANSKAGQALEVALINVTLDAASQYISSGNIEPKQLVAAALDGAADGLRSVAGTPQATSPRAISDAVALGANVPGVSKAVPQVVAANVSRQIQTGIHPDQAIENLATVMNKAASDSRKTPNSKR